MSRRVLVLGGEPSVARAVREAFDAAGAEARAAATAADAGASDAVVDLGLSPDGWPGAGALAAAERERAAELADPRPGRWVRVSVLGAAPEGRSALQRAQGAAEAALRERRPVVALRAGLVLGACGIHRGLRRLVERSPVVPVAGFGSSRLEPLALGDLAAYCVEAALVPRELADVYDLGCGEMITGHLYVAGIADALGLSRAVVPLPGVCRAAVAPLLASAAYPRRAAARMLEALAGALLPRRVNAWEDFETRPLALREALAGSVGMTLAPRRREPDAARFDWRRRRRRVWGRRR